MNELTQEQRNVLTVWEYLKDHGGELGGIGVSFDVPGGYIEFEDDGEADWLAGAAEWVREQQASAQP